MAGDLNLNPVAFGQQQSLAAEDQAYSVSNSQSALRAVDEPDEDTSEQNRLDQEEALIAELSPTGQGRLVIEKDDETGHFVQKIIDPDTKEVLRQWPEEEFLALAKQFDKAYGLLVDRSV